ncbi:hypothetical protein [Natrinema pallidum]|uniref:Uncharacterized protein n=1 Tax=Natrinema pallidum DSM 3751 TaxID=1227495 RepID=L9YRD7_9EURY|nr:hypothetical protein [Natrinema pallidum]ELY76684.1 hypothetical protein C487_10897 [Natrinema pallidum DSM 3751]
MGASAGLASTGITAASVSVGAEKNPTGTEDAGIQKPVQQLLRNRNPEKAAQLMDKKGVEYDQTAVGMPLVLNQKPGEDNGGEDDGISTQAEYNKSNSQLVQTVRLVSGSIYRSTISWVLEYEGEIVNACVDSAGPKDGVSVGFSGAYWEPVNDSWRFGSNTTFDDRKTEGVIGKFDDPEYVPATGCNGGIRPKVPSLSRRSSWMKVDLRKKQSGKHNVYGTYAHTWNPFSLPSGVTFSISLGILSVSTGPNAQYWKRRSDVNK